MWNYCRLFASNWAYLLVVFVGSVGVASAGDELPPDSLSVKSQQIEQWLRDLQSDRFQQREQASENLALAGRHAVGPLLAVILQSESIEAGRRAVDLLREIGKTKNPADYEAAIDALEKAQGIPDNVVIPRRAADALNYLSEFRMLQAWQDITTSGGHVPLPAPTGVSRFTPTALPYTELEIGEDWQGGVEGLAALKWLTRVSKLVLVGPQVTGRWLPYLAKMPNLQRLSIANSSPITAEDWEHLRTMKNLFDLKIEGSTIDDTGLAHVGTLARLQFLTVEGAEITDAGIGHVMNLTRLRSFTLKHSSVTDAGIGALGDLKNLESVTIEGSLASGKSLARLAALPFLSYLTIAGERVTDDWLVHVAKLRKLHVVQIKSASITDEGLAPLRQLRELWQLSIFNTSISDHGLEVLLGTSLDTKQQAPPLQRTLFRVRQNVSLIGTDVTETGAKRFEAALARLNPPPFPKVDFRAGGFLGVSPKPGFTPCTIRYVVPGSAAAKAGLKANDVIVKYNGESVDEFQSLTRMIGKNRVGHRVRIDILRGTQAMQLELVLGAWK